MQMKEVATLGGGCFWCLEAVFEQLKGVEKVESGYSGGTVKNPSYQDVCTGRTGHAEVVQITFDAANLTFRELLEVFFTIHDPTTLNRQGADVGPHDQGQKEIAEQVIRAFDGAAIWNAPIVTEVSPFAVFYKAEDSHQEYFRRNPGQSYCQVVIAPKVAKFRQRYLARLKN
jgi:peptide-methionine (S)-S-oxide reductase